MKWILFTGTWRLTNKQVEEDVRKAAREVIARGDGIVTGGSTGVDYFAMDEALKLNPDASQLKVIIPAYLEDYITDYHTNWLHEPITEDEVNKISSLLKKLKQTNPESLIEMPNKTITQEHYDLRNEEEIKYSNEVYAFQINDSTGTQHTINHAHKMGIPVTLYKRYQF